MFRIPLRFLDAEVASAYCDGEVLSLKAKKEHVVLEFSSEDESGDEWTEGEHWMPSLISLRAELMGRRLPGPLPGMACLARVARPGPWGRSG